MKNLLALTLPGTEEPINEDLGALPEAPDSFGNYQLANLSLAEIINLIIPTLFVLGGLTLFIMLIVGGLTIFTSAGNPEKMKQGQGRITSALIGFLIMFAAYWIVQLIEYSLGLNLLGA